MDFPFQLTANTIDRIQAWKDSHTKTDSTNSSKENVRDIKSLAYVLLHETLRTRLPGQPQLNAFNHFINHELDHVFREQGQPIQVCTINTRNNVAIEITFSDISVESPTHIEPDGTRIHLLPKDVSERRIPYDINVMVDLHVVQNHYSVVPTLKKYKDGPAFFSNCLVINDPYNFNGKGVALGRETTGTPEQHLASAQFLRFEPGVFEAFHKDACRRHNHRSRCPVDVHGYKKQLWTRLNAMDQKKDFHHKSDVKAMGMAQKLMVFIVAMIQKQMNSVVEWARKTRQLW